MAFLANGNTTTRGPYAENVERVVQYLSASPSPTASSPAAAQEQGRPMYGHGFALMFLASAYGMETDPKLREEMRKVDRRRHRPDRAAARATSAGGRTCPGGGDEGSVTVTQIQAPPRRPQRRVHRAQGRDRRVGALPRALQGPRGRDRLLLRLRRRGPARDLRAPPSRRSTTPASTTPSSPTTRLNYVWEPFKANGSDWNSAFGHGFYAHLYASQAFYQAGDEYWDTYFPTTRDSPRRTARLADGSWMGDGIGNIYGTAIALTILQLPYKFLPIYQR